MTVSVMTPVPKTPAPVVRSAPLGVSGVTRPEVLSFVQNFYQQVRADDLLAPVFSRIVPDAHWPEHMETLTDFWMAVAFGGSSFRGDPMLKHARIKDLSSEHFERWLQIFRRVAQVQWPERTAAVLILRAEQIAPALLNGGQRAHEKGLVSPEELH